MNDIEKLEERIAQLTELVNTGTETLESLKETLKTVEKERDRLADQRAGVEPRFERVKENESYYFISSLFGGFYVDSDTEEGHPLDDSLYNANNYFHTKWRAQEIADKCNFLLKLERLHDIYCPNCENGRYYISQNIVTGRYCYGYIANVSTKHPTSTMFPSEEIALKVCNILNKELEEKK